MLSPPLALSLDVHLTSSRHSVAEAEAVAVDCERPRPFAHEDHFVVIGHSSHAFAAFSVTAMTHAIEVTVIVPRAPTREPNCGPAGARSSAPARPKCPPGFAQ